MKNANPRAFVLTAMRRGLMATGASTYFVSYALMRKRKVMKLPLRTLGGKNIPSCDNRCVNRGDDETSVVLIEGTPLLALVDTGSTHNFINTSTALGLALPTAPRPGVKVVVANGDSLSSTCLCEQVLVSKGSDSFLVNLFQIPLVGFDLVLGIQWLSTLGPIWWDFNSLTM
nr:uncharacterized protein LOC109155092 [Ipomoea trifida]